MIAKLIDKGQQCGFGLKDGPCGKPALCSVGNTKLCRDHFEYAADLQPMEFMASTPPVPPKPKVRLRKVGKREFLADLAAWERHE